MARKRKQKRPGQKRPKQNLGSLGEIRNDPQRRAKLQAAAKKRKRRPKGTPGGGRFAAGGVGHKPYSVADVEALGRTSGAGRKGRVNPRGGRMPQFQRSRTHGVVFGTSGSHVREQMAGNLDQARHNSPRQNQRDAAYYKTRTQTGASNVPPPEADEASVRVTHHDVRRAEMARRDATWQKGRGTFQTEDAPKGKYTTPTQFLREEAPPSMQKQISKDLDDPNSWMNKGLRKDQKGTARFKTKDSLGRPAVVGRLSPAQRRRLDKMVKGLQDGKSYEEMAYSIGEVETRGRKATTSKRVGKTAGARNEDIQDTLSAQGSRRGRKGKYDSLTPRREEINVGLDAQHVDKITDLARMLPNMTDRDLIKLQQGQRENIWSQQIERNAKWAQETRAANMTDTKPGERKDPNRVVFFTTSLGHPAPSVPSDSLIGQYIIRRRKKMLLEEGVAKERDVAGSYPDAVRDMHIIEASTGMSLGAQGDVGAFKRAGFRVGTKKSTGYGKPVPVGSQVLYDSQGRPMYDSQGNIRYTEGATRRFNVTTPDLGFRVFIG